MINEQEFIPQISKGYTCKLCGIEVPQGEFHDCELYEPLKWGQIASDNQKTTPSDWLERISSLSKLCDEKSNRIKELEAQLQDEQKKTEAVQGHVDGLWETIEEKDKKITELTAQLQAAKAWVVPIQEFLKEELTEMCQRGYLWALQGKDMDYMEMMRDKFILDSKGRFRLKFPLPLPPDKAAYIVSTNESDGLREVELADKIDNYYKNNYVQGETSSGERLNAIYKMLYEFSHRTDQISGQSVNTLTEDKTPTFTRRDPDGEIIQVGKIDRG